MFDALNQLFSPQPASDPAKQAHRLHLATAVLMIEIGSADFHIDEAELEALADALQQRFGLSSAELAELLELAHQQSQDSHSLHPFLRRINQHFDPQQKAAILEDLWRVAFADGRLDKYEEYHIRRIADLLHLPHSAFIRAKHRAEAERD
jgi:uncharacterized tellurite resistance protein B-like protein